MDVLHSCLLLVRHSINVSLEQLSRVKMLSSWPSLVTGDLSCEGPKLGFLDPSKKGAAELREAGGYAFSAACSAQGCAPGPRKSPLLALQRAQPAPSFLSTAPTASTSHRPTTIHLRRSFNNMSSNYPAAPPSYTAPKGYQAVPQHDTLHPATEQPTLPLPAMSTKKAIRTTSSLASPSSSRRPRSVPCSCERCTACSSSRSSALP